jgi:hypothetical protein
LVAPICFLVLAAIADRVLHHAPPPVREQRATAPAPRPAPAVQSIIVPDAPVASAKPQTALDLLHEIRRSCPHPERADGCSPVTLTAALADDMPAVRAHYRTLEERYLARLASGDYVPIHALGFLRSRRALPALREALFMVESPTDWNLAEPNEPAIFYADAQFPRHLALMQAIESIEGRPIRRAFKLTRAERSRLSRVAAGCHGETSAQWLLYKLAGTPLPAFSELRAHRAACHARVRGL